MGLHGDVIKKIAADAKAGGKRWFKGGESTPRKTDEENNEVKQL